MFECFKKKVVSIPEDHDPFNNKKGPGATAWFHSYVCYRCHEQINHQEFMTNICLSCGQNCTGAFSVTPPSGALRDIVYKGQWVRQLRVHSDNYLKINDEWIRIFPQH